ncbi:MAG: GTPase [Burkholderiaceae bacterium]
MTVDEQKSLLTIAVFAAFADRARADREREEIRRVTDASGGESNFAALYRDVLLARTSVAAEAAKLASPDLRRLAFELAVGACDADGLRNDAETRFLAELGQALGLSQPAMAEAAAIADALATAPLETAPQPAAVAASTPSVADAELDRMILNDAIRNGALELLPQSMAALAVIALQMKMVYRIGRAHGCALDRGRVEDLFATVGVDPTGQYLEQIGRKLADGRFDSTAGGIAGAPPHGAAGMARSFATTYALGHVASRHYAGGGTMDANRLKDAFAALAGQARSLQRQYAPQIERQARTMDVAHIVQMVRSR